MMLNTELNTDESEVCAIFGCTEMNTGPVDHEREGLVYMEWEHLYAAPYLCAIIIDARSKVTWIPVCTFHYQGYLVCLKAPAVRGEWSVG